MRWIAAIMISLILCGAQHSAAQSLPYSLDIRGSFTTSSKLFPQPHDANNLLRSQFVPFDNIVGIGVDLRRHFEEIGITGGLSIEYLGKSREFDYPNTAGPIPLHDGFTAVPVELTGYFFIPVGTDQFHLYMGGGAGLYFGTRSYEYGTIAAPAEEHSLGSGIHVVSGMEFGLPEALSIRTEVKFRDVNFESTNRFSAVAPTSDPFQNPTNSSPFTSRINIDGMNVSVGLAYHF